jgi:hypothetical protein
MARLATSVNHLSDALNSSAHEVMLMNIAQANAVRATDGLIGTLQQMNETVMNALVGINATAARVNQTIGVNFYSSLYSIFLSLAGAIALSCEENLISPPFVRYRATDRHTAKQISLLYLVVSTVVRLLWSTLQHLPSFLVMVSRFFSYLCARMIPW